MGIKENFISNFCQLKKHSELQIVKYPQVLTTS
jgi:hypothetical protein